MKKQILVAPLNWGLGHATRCIPIIKALIQHDFKPIIASDGIALDLLKHEFPELETVELPSYDITYTKNGKFFKFNLLKDSPRLLKAIKNEYRATKSLIDKYNISGIISDNRLGVRHRDIPSVFITHQINVLSGNTTWLSSKMHQHYIKKFDDCWVPDSDSKIINLSGKLGHSKKSSIPKTYIGPLSRFKKSNLDIKYDVMVLLSGPEPQRTFLEEKLLDELKSYSGSVVFVKGVVEDKQSVDVKGNMTIYNYMTSNMLEKTINESHIIISRSGYTTLMDLAKLNKKCFFIPTPGQFEQEYLAKRLSNMELAPSCNQDNFSVKEIDRAASYKGLRAFDYKTDYKTLFSSFANSKVKENSLPTPYSLSM